jgi:hypothetical protein
MPNAPDRLIRDRFVPITRRVDTDGSLIGGGHLDRDLTLQLDGDLDSPDPLSFYGTDIFGERGWFLLSTISGGSGVTTFLGLTDVPSSYVGQSLKGVRVNVGETGLEFFTTAGGGTVTNFTSGNLSPLFTTSVATSSSTPALSFSLSTVAAHQFLGNHNISPAVPTFIQVDFSDLSGTALLAQLPASLLTSVPQGATIYVDSINGNDSTGTRGHIEKPFLTISAAFSAGSNGDIVKVGPGTFAENLGLQQPSGVSLIGSGIDVTTITSSLNSTTLADYSPGTGAITADVTIQATGAGNAQPVGVKSSNTGFTNATFFRVKVVGSTDGYYFNKTGDSSTLKCYDCYTTTNFDTCVVKAGTAPVLEFWDSEFFSDGGGVNTVHGPVATVGTVRLFNCKVTTQNTTTGQENISLKVNGGTTEAHNIRIHRDGTGTTVADLYQTSGTLNIENISRDDGAALTTIGTIGQLSRYTIRDNNLSDLVSSSTARTNLAIFTGSPSTGNIAKFSAATQLTNATAKTDYWDTTVFVASGLLHSIGLVPDPGSSSGTTRFLREDSSWQVPSYAIGANPSASVGLTAVNGSAATFLRSDGAPVLSQSIVPTWTGAHTFNIAPSVIVSDAATNTSISLLSLTHNTSGTPVAGYGAYLNYFLQDATTATQEASRLQVSWLDPAHVTHSAVLDILLSSNGAAPSQIARFSATAGLSVGDNNSQAIGIINARSGYTVGNSSATSGKIAIGDGAKLIYSTPTWPLTAGTSGYTVRSDGTNFSSYPQGLCNSNTAAQASSFAADTYITGSNVVVAAGDWKAKGQYHVRFDMTKTAAGVAAPVLTVRIGTAGTIADTGILTFTLGIGTAAIDAGVFDLWVTFRSVGSGTAAVVQGTLMVWHNLSAAGLTTTADKSLTPFTLQTSSGFASNAATNLGVSFNGGTSFSGTIQSVDATLEQP